MSRVFDRNGGWYADYTDERGQRIKRRLPGVTSKRVADDYLAELVAQARRRKLGLEPAATRSPWSVWDLLEWWLVERCPKASQDNERRRLTKHVKRTELAVTLAAHAQSAQFEELFSKLERAEKPLSPGSINHLRAKMRTAFNRARRENRFAGTNPLLDTQKRKVPKKLYTTVTADEIELILEKVPPQWRGFIAAAVYLGMRKGEIAGALKGHANLKDREFLVARSYERETTKGGHWDLLPIPEPMMPHLVTALKSPGPLLFGDVHGRMRKRYARPDVVLRRAMKNAHLVTGYVLSCRRCKAQKHAQPYSITVPILPAPVPVCPVCEKQRLWVTPIPRRVRFHDLRHSTATILLRAGVDPHRVQRLMRHEDFDTTSKTYAHLIVEDLRAAQGAFDMGAPSKLQQLLAALKSLRSEIHEAAEIDTQWEALDVAYRAFVGEEPEPEERKAAAK